ncbi:DUF6538 domain-containing protein [Ottowia oryzae]|uniref:DUF6538 domain-containing protein n=1 Tax=Ottowia oryzae TaxID=2109914 RepID=UPI000F512A7C|nr:DUF6538 domain-containing protein [Ottowia oryzae]
MNGLFRRGGVWWARLAIPEHLRAAAGRREFVQSTRTYHHEVAKVVAASLIAAWRHQLLRLDSRRMDERDILKLVSGSPLLNGDGFLSLKEAAQASGLPESELLRRVQRGALGLHYTVPHANGNGYKVPKPDLEPDDPELGIDAGIIAPNFKGNSAPASAQRINVSGQTLRLVDGALFAGLLLDGKDAVTGFVLRAPDQAGVRANASVANVVKDGQRLEAELAPEKWYFPDVEFTEVPTSLLLVAKRDIESIRVELAAAVSPKRAEDARKAVLSSGTEKKHVARAPEKTEKLAGKRFSEAVAIYCEDPHGLSRKLSEKNEIALRKRALLLFAELMGDMLITAIDRDILAKYLYEVLPEVPNKPNNLPGDVTWVENAEGSRRKATMKEIISTLEARSWTVNGKTWQKITDAARDERRQWLCNIFVWAHESGYIGANPAASFLGKKIIEKRKKGSKAGGERTRNPFSDDQLVAIFEKGRFKSGGEGSHAQEWHNVPV